MKNILVLFAALLFTGVGTNAFAQQTSRPKVVYHIDNVDSQGTKSLHNISYHLDNAPDTIIIVVTHYYGYDLLIKGAKDKTTNIEYAPQIAALKARGVKFEVCENTIHLRNLKKEQFISEADFTPSGLVRITTLQNKDGFAYIKP
jgi:intracellular sulfur oxidation DsrE/DsrF family protein